jgi:hypothetical protein
MILNNNSLPWPMSIGLKAIILKHLAHRNTATVLSFNDRNNGHDPVEIAIDVDGSIIQIVADNIPLALEEQGDLCDWDRNFVENYRLGEYKVDILPLIDLEELAN